ncbi:hypothetical protein VTN02DRAFT_1232 [Thermoascus thermophilus]
MAASTTRLQSSAMAWPLDGNELTLLGDDANCTRTRLGHTVSDLGGCQALFVSSRSTTVVAKTTSGARMPALGTGQPLGLRRWIWLPLSHYGPSAARLLAGGHEIANPAKLSGLLSIRLARGRAS